MRSSVPLMYGADEVPLMLDQSVFSIRMRNTVWMEEVVGRVVVVIVLLVVVVVGGDRVVVVGVDFVVVVVGLVVLLVAVGVVVLGA